MSCVQLQSIMIDDYFVVDLHEGMIDLVIWWSSSLYVEIIS